MMTSIKEHTTMILFAIGAQVVHKGHGPGVVVEYNKHNGPFYGGRRYPYVIKFASGYEEVYSNICVTPALALPAPANDDSDCCPNCLQEGCGGIVCESELEDKIEHLFTEGRMEVAGDDR